ncbi:MULTISPECIES: SLC13 family permease [Stenotrophomonas]|uniref:Di/tricarboxylate transporter n=1 Tax=Stenotrophomonas rhizophila TaxID=216778 RepID=A0AAP5AJU9_9GAMM|nr:SLC13 family permease [Stenotrophomonas rhizophila]MDQ1109416.1 di/tricarboxylate transporter [Stenotrophomonas rhizophila]
MSPQIATIIGLVIMFIIATALPINMGAVAFALAFIIGGIFVGMEGKEVLGGFPGDLFLTLVGITYLFAIAQKNGTIDLLVHWAVRAVRGRIVAIPWVMFVVTAVLTAFGALGPAAVAIIGPVALRFAKQYRINPLMMGLLVIHGAQAGGFSPISVYGSITNGVVQKAGLEVTEMAVFLTSLGFNFMMATICFFAFGGVALMRRGAVAMGGGELALAGGPQASSRQFAIEGHGALVSAGGGTLSNDPDALEAVGITRERLFTLVGLIGLGVAALIYNLNVGLVSITVAVVLALLSPASQKGAVDGISWSTVLLICGVVTYVGVLEKAGSVDFIGNGVSNIGIPLLGALLVCYVGGIVSAFASSAAVLGATIPLAVPFLLQGHLGAAGVICALAVSSTIVDVSPFSTNGALVVASAAKEERESLFRRFLVYSGLVVVFGPLLAWLLFVVPGWM